MSEPVIKVRDLTKRFEVQRGLMQMFGKQLYVHAVNDINFDIFPGEVLGMVGESGCGKTTTGRLLTRLEEPSSGSILFKGDDIAHLKGASLKRFRRNVQMIFQDPYESLNPRFSTFDTVSEPLTVHGVGDTYDERLEMVIRALEYAELGPAEEYMERFPHELSGGQRQRVAIARTLSLRPEFIVADEPVSMLDVSIRAGIMNLLLQLKTDYEIPFMFVTHDVSVARYMSDRVAVMYLGEIVELAKTDEVIQAPEHPYTKALLSAVPVPDPTLKHKRIEIMGDLPSPINKPHGCTFHPRCLYAKDICKTENPQMQEVAPGHFVHCHFAGHLELRTDIPVEVLDRDLQEESAEAQDSIADGERAPPI